MTVAFAVTIQGRESVLPHHNLSMDEFTTLYGHFRRTFTAASLVDTTEGDFYYLGPQKMFIEVTYPLRQIMLIEGKVTTIFYPLERTAFRLESENPAILPLIPGLMAAIRPDFGLGDLGFTLYSQEMRGDTVVSSWSHPKARSKIGDYKIAEVKDRLAYTLYVSPDSSNRNRTNFSNYLALGGVSFPTRISSAAQSTAGKAFELVTLSGLKMNLEIPPAVANFQIPADVTVTKRKW